MSNFGGVYTWSGTAANNATADSTVNWSPLMSPSSVSPSGRAMMASVAKFRDDTSGMLVATGLGTVASPFIITSNQNFTALQAGLTVAFQIPVGVPTPAKVNIDGLGALPLRPAAGVEFTAGQIAANALVHATYFTTNSGEWIVKGVSQTILSTAQVGTSNIADKAVTLQKLYHPTATSRLLGSDSNAALTITNALNNGSGLIRLVVGSTSTFATGQVKTVSDVVGTTEANGTWTITVVDATHIDLQGSAFVNAYVSGGTIGGGVEEISLGTGLVLTGSVLSAPSIPVPAVFKNLSIKVASNTTVTVAADYITVTDGSGNFQTLAFSGTINFGTTGANALDAGTIAIDTWYSIWAIAQPGGTTALLASTSSTAPTMPSGYTQKARVGWVKTTHASATLIGTWQFGRKARYVVGLAQCTALPNMAIGVAGNVTTPTWVAVTVNGGNVQASYVPSTASMIDVAGLNTSGGTAVLTAAPNASYGGAGSTANPPPFIFANFSGNAYGTILFSLMLEAATIQWASNASGNAIYCAGWEDNI